MIRSKDLNTEIKALGDTCAKEKVEDSLLLKAIVKGITLVLKVLRDIRVNQVLGLKKAGVELVKPTSKDEDTTEG